MKVLLVEPDFIIRSEFRALLQRLESNLTIFDASDCVTALVLMGQHRDLDLVVAEFRMACACGLLRAKDCSRPLATKLVVLSCAPGHSEMLAAVEHGAMAYLPGNSPPSVLQAGLQMVLAGGKYFPADLMIAQRAEEWQAHPSVSPKLTPRQVEVLTLMAAGRPNKDIARELGMSAGTVKVHVTAILKALNARNRTEAVVSAQHGDVARRRMASQVISDL